MNKILSVNGIGLHFGEFVNVLVTSTSHKTGYRFFKNSIPVPFSVLNTELCTVIGNEYITISTIEHFMSLFYALNIFNVDIHINGPEMPILDGSSIDVYNKIISQDFIVDTTNNPEVIVIDKEYIVEDGESYIKISPSDRTEINFTIDFDHPLIGKQEYNLILTPETYINEIAPARTFGFFEEYGKLKSLGYAKGGSLSNVIVLTEDGMMNETKLRYPDEFVRHKILDLIGDFSLLGRPIQCKIEAHKSGHRLNHRIVNEIKKDM